MTLCDAGPHIALINRNDNHHFRCREALPSLDGPLLTTWPCFAEAMYLLEHNGGPSSRRDLWAYVRRGALRFHCSSEEEIRRMDELMERYADRPMDLGDASLVAAAEVLNQHLVFTVDSDFHIYRWRDEDPFEAIPGPLPTK